MHRDTRRNCRVLCRTKFRCVIKYSVFISDVVNSMIRLFEWVVLSICIAMSVFQTYIRASSFVNFTAKIFSLACSGIMLYICMLLYNPCFSISFALKSG